MDVPEGEKEKEWGGEEKATDGRGRTDGLTGGLSNYNSNILD